MAFNCTALNCEYLDLTFKSHNKLLGYIRVIKRNTLYKRSLKQKMPLQIVKNLMGNGN